MFHEYIRMKNLNYKTKNIEIKYLNYMRKTRFLKVKIVFWYWKKIL